MEEEGWDRRRRGGIGEVGGGLGRGERVGE